MSVWLGAEYRPRSERKLEPASELEAYFATESQIGQM
jgi:hypothetical protein